MKIRPGLYPDIQTIADLQVTMAWETEEFKLDPATVFKGVSAVIDDPSKGKYWVAEVEGKLAGCLLTVPEWSDWRNGTILWIHSVYVLKTHRGQGLYKALYQHVQKLVSDNPQTYKGIRLYVDKRNTSAQEVYTKLGMNGEHYQLFEWIP
ncbi:MAG: GNAT family N-acetyltransferase [Bacteriovoracaceae bacterium]|nr:GNAT family N-acetyltransferase [Bacteriovoracaceae bacterium]